MGGMAALLLALEGEGPATVELVQTSHPAIRTLRLRTALAAFSIPKGAKIVFTVQLETAEADTLGALITRFTLAVVVGALSGCAITTGPCAPATAAALEEAELALALSLVTRHSAPKAFLLTTDVRLASTVPAMAVAVVAQPDSIAALTHRMPVALGARASSS
jgi:hypothetical protein